ncbi:DNA polymerase IV [Candidatus Uhrbacteria bacterium]|nr:DNA polymerase IV [Candidatus Uhrbacteria bacterium]
MTKAILHIDGDAFFASCEQARDPALAGRPVITGKERGIASSLSYEAKARGVKRGMPLWEIRKICPEAVILPSDYQTYSIISQRFFSIVKRYASVVEEYSIDECFADITGLAPLEVAAPLSSRLVPEGRARLLTGRDAGYAIIMEQLQRDLYRQLGVSFSLGLGPTKVLAKVGSKWKKPAGRTIIQVTAIEEYLRDLPLENVWGIGRQTSAHLSRYGIATAYEFTQLSSEWVMNNLSKPFVEIWQELNGISVLPLETAERKNTHSIQKMKTFSPSSSDKGFLFSQLSKNIENACMKARKYRIAPREATFFLRTHDFRDIGIRVSFSRATVFPNKIITLCENIFGELYNPRMVYRSTGVVLSKLTSDISAQLDLFGTHLEIEKMTRLYHGIDILRKKYGKYTVHLGSSTPALHRPTHTHEDVYERNCVPARTHSLLNGESFRRRLAIPMLFGNGTL